MRADGLFLNKTMRLTATYAVPDSSITMKIAVLRKALIPEGLIPYFLAQP